MILPEYSFQALASIPAPLNPLYVESGVCQWYQTKLLRENKSHLRKKEVISKVKLPTCKLFFYIYFLVFLVSSSLCFFLADQAFALAVSFAGSLRAHSSCTVCVRANGHAHGRWRVPDHPLLSSQVNITWMCNGECMQLQPLLKKTHQFASRGRAKPYCHPAHLCHCHGNGHRSSLHNHVTLWDVNSLFSGITALMLTGRMERWCPRPESPSILYLSCLCSGHIQGASAIITQFI